LAKFGSRAWARDFWVPTVWVQAVLDRMLVEAELMKNLTEMEAGFTLGLDAMNYF